MINETLEEWFEKQEQLEKEHEDLYSYLYSKIFG